MNVTNRTDWSEEGLKAAELDCVWVSFFGRKDAGPLKTKLLQWIDWKLQGALSKFLLEERHRGEMTTFLPTFSRIPVRLVAVEPSGTPSWELFLKNCEGMGLSKVAVVLEDGTRAGDFEKSLKAHRTAKHPLELTLISDTAI